jgi:glycogen phosphorylase
MTLVKHEHRTGRSVDSFKRALADNLYYTRGQAIYGATKNDLYVTLCFTVRDYLIRRWRETVEAYHEAQIKFVAYFSAEYLMGPQLKQNLIYTETVQLARQALSELGYDLDDLVAQDIEPGLGNGGLGRLAACFLDSLATLGVPAIGYGIRYEFGIFQQSFEDGWQVESPDPWLQLGNPWEFPQPDDRVEVCFGGITQGYTDENGQFRKRWIPGSKVLGEPCHMLVPGYGNTTVNLLRLWRARATDDFDFQLFDIGDYTRAVEQKTASENISKVLYPNDTSPQGRELRLKQQYFFVACSLRDIIRLGEYKGDSWDELPNKVAIQLNDTHPVIAIPELMRIMLDEEGLGWDKAWDLCSRTFASTQHTLLPEAMEMWPVSLLEKLLPRHLEIIYEINHRFLEFVRESFPGDEERVERVSIIAESPSKMVRMAHLACVGSFSVNGVAQLQSDLLKQRVLRDFHVLWPEKFSNKTNGVTLRRFVRMANPRLSDLIDHTIGRGWLNDADRLRELEEHVDDASFRADWAAVKLANKKELAAIIEQRLGIQVDPHSMFDVMVKRLHEYKRQLLNALHIITLYHRIKSNPDAPMVPRTFVFGAKAAPGYRKAKLIIKLINNIANVVNNDPKVGKRLKVAFLPNFNVRLGETIYPAADVSEQISLAGKEASGTGNMKFALNGAVTIGTLDGANIEIRDCVGAENFFLFGLRTEEVFEQKAAGYDPGPYYRSNSELRQAIDALAWGRFSGGDQEVFKPIVQDLMHNDEYMLMADYEDYVATQDQLAEAFRDRERWLRMSILNTARCGFFSSDRTMRQYCEDIWNISALEIELED